jgi:glutathione synthase/RimK-type ligase-like ATP-grasp enzyme
MILIFSQFAEDPTVTTVNRILSAAGADVVNITTADLERPSSLTIDGDAPGGPAAWLRLEDRTVDLRAVRTVWVWRGWAPHALVNQYRAIARDAERWGFFSSEWISFHRGTSLLMAELGAFCVNPPPWNTAFEEKCCQLMLAAEVGLRVPTTLYTTRLPVAREFFDRQGGELIYKPFRAFVQVTERQQDDGMRVAKLLTNRVRAEDLVEPEGFAPTPGIFQPYVHKQFEVRVVVVGRRLFACAIQSQRSERTRDDWRRYDHPNTPYEVYDLPADVADKLLRLMERMRLVFGSIDLIVTPDGEHVFLEVNPNGQFDFIAKLAGLPIYEHFAAMLLDARVDYSPDLVARCALC